MGHQTMGVGLPWAIGALLARPGESAVSISGDGSFLMTCMELESAVRLKLPTVHLVCATAAITWSDCLPCGITAARLERILAPTDFVASPVRSAPPGSA